MSIANVFRAVSGACAKAADKFDAMTFSSHELTCKNLDVDNLIYYKGNILTCSRVKIGEETYSIVTWKKDTD